MKTWWRLKRAFTDAVSLVGTETALGCVTDGNGDITATASGCMTDRTVSGCVMGGTALGCMMDSGGTDTRETEGGGRNADIIDENEGRTDDGE